MPVGDSLGWIIWDWKTHLNLGTTSGGQLKRTWNREAFVSCRLALTLTHKFDYPVAETFLHWYHIHWYHNLFLPDSSVEQSPAAL